MSMIKTELGYEYTVNKLVLICARKLGGETLCFGYDIDGMGIATIAIFDEFPVDNMHDIVVMDVHQFVMDDYKRDTRKVIASILQQISEEDLKELTNLHYELLKSIYCKPQFNIVLKSEWSMVDCIDIYVESKG